MVCKPTCYFIKHLEREEQWDLKVSSHSLLVPVDPYRTTWFLRYLTKKELQGIYTKTAEKEFSGKQKKIINSNRNQKE